MDQTFAQSTLLIKPQDIESTNDKWIYSWTSIREKKRNIDWYLIINII